MSREGPKKGERVQIYMQLLNEGTDLYRPTMAEVVGDGIYRVLRTENYDPEDEEWEFLPDTLVKCIEKSLIGRGDKVSVRLVPVEKVEE